MKAVTIICAMLGCAHLSLARAELEPCALAQMVIAGTQLVPNVETPGDYDAFVESKATDQPFVVQQYLSNPMPSDARLMRTLSCKMRTAERINAAHSEADTSPPASGDTSCAQVQHTLLQRVRSEIPDAELVLNPDHAVIEDESSTFMGPMWLDPWPFSAVSGDGEGSLRLASRALHVPWAWWIPLPERFKGNYYCHLAAPDYLRALLKGEAVP